jgi:hypothetical protein
VITLSPKDDSFSGHARRNRPRFVLNARSERFECLTKNVPGGIHIPVKFKAADWTSMNTNMQTLLDNRPTPTTHLGCVGWVHGNQLATSFFRFVCQQFHEHTEPCVVRGKREMFVRCHESEVEVFDGDQRMRVGKITSGFMPVILPLVLDLFMQPGNLLGCLSPAFTPLLPPSQSTVCHPELFKRSSQPSWVFVQIALAGGEKRYQAHVNSDRFPLMYGCAVWIWNINHQVHVPFVVLGLDHHMLDDRSLRNLPVVNDLDFAYVLEIDLDLTLRVRSEFTPVTVAVLHALETISALEARKSRGLSSIQSSEESTKRFIQSAEKLLKAGGIQQTESVWVLPAQVPEMRPLLCVFHTDAGLLVCVNPLFEREIVDRAGLPKQEIQPLDLRPVWAQPVLVSADHLLPFLVLDVHSDSSFRHMSNASDVVRSGPQGWEPGFEQRKFGPEKTGCVALELVHDSLGWLGRIRRNEPVDMIRHDSHRLNVYANLISLLQEQAFQPGSHFADQCISSEIRTPNDVVFEHVNATCAGVVLSIYYRTIVLRMFTFYNWQLSNTLQYSPNSPVA